MIIRCCALLFFMGVAFAQTQRPAGDYSGMLGPLHLKLHIQSGADGKLTATLDSTDQGARGLPCANLQSQGNGFSFDVPSVGGKWHGTVSADGATLTGSWSQGAEMPLAFQRDQPFLAARTPSRVDGVWLGTLDAPGGKLRLQVTIKSDRNGKEYCSADSLDQGAVGLPCENVQLHDNQVSFEVPVVHGRWTGTLSANANELHGVWSQGADLPLNLTRQTVALAPNKPDPPKYESPLPAVPVASLQATLDRDLAAALRQGALAPATGSGVVIGVVQHGQRRLFVYGAVKEDSIFEIGSISKTFTGLILAQMVVQHKVKLDDPVRDFLPQGIAPKPAGSEITLLDLATQHSGLPRMPDNFHPADPQDPYADYRPANLYEFVARHGLQKPAKTSFGYSNLGLGLLGQALSNHASMTYPELLKFEITQPLSLSDTVVQLSPAQEKRFAQGHTAEHQPAHAWAIDALAGAGAIRSTAGDMLTYLEAQLHPEAINGNSHSEDTASPSKTMESALQMSHELHAEALPGMQVALAWLYDTKTGDFWHNGATGGYSSYAFFNLKDDTAGIVLLNTTIGARGSFADRLGQHVAERLTGKPAISLDN